MMKPPDWCDEVSEHGGNRRFTTLPQHPCKFLREPGDAAAGRGAG